MRRAAGGAGSVLVQRQRSHDEVYNDLDGDIVNVMHSARYKALGNSMAIPPMRWIGDRIEFIEAIMRERAGR